MKKKLALGLCLLLAGCTDTDWDRALNYGSSPEMETAPAPPPTVATAAPAPVGPTLPPNDDFCRAVATQDATGNGFDPATQTRVMARSYAQCVAIYTR